MRDWRKIFPELAYKAGMEKAKTIPRTAFRKGEKRPNQGKHGPPKVTLQLKEMILGALDAAGGLNYLKEQAEKNPGPFLALVGKVLPTTISGDPTAPLSIHIVRYGDSPSP